MLHIALLRQVINHWRFVCDASSSASCYQVWKVVVLFEPLPRFSEDGVEFSPYRAILDIFDFACEIDPAVPDFHGRQFGKATHAGPIGFDRLGRCGTGSLFRK